MKIICLIRQKPLAFYFVNMIHAKHPVSLVVIERKGAALPSPQASLWERLRQRMREGKWALLFRSLLDYLTRPMRHLLTAQKRAKLRAVYQSILGSAWQELNPEIPILWVRNINDEAVRAKLENERPDVLVDHGTSIVKPHILSLAPVTLNLHWGLSPYYRGTNCTDWALLHNDPLNIGVTVHKLAQEVDGGDIVGQARAIPEPTDIVRSINTKLTKAGTEIMIRALDLLARGEPLQFFKQDLTIGLLTRGRDYTNAVAKKVSAIEKHGLRDIIEHPSKDRLPIIEIS